VSVAIHGRAAGPALPIASPEAGSRFHAGGGMTDPYRLRPPACPKKVPASAYWRFRHLLASAARENFLLQFFVATQLSLPKCPAGE